MITDKLTTFAKAVALNTGAAGTYNVGDIIDLEQVRDIGNSADLYLVVSMNTAATSGGAATAQFKLVSDATSSISTTTATVHATSGATPVASMTAGARLFAVELPLEASPYERYIGVQQVTGTAAFTGGTFSAFLTTDPSAWKAYADGNN